MTVHSININEFKAKLYPQAKLNLRLKIVGKREDGYHLLSMLNTPCSLTDEVSIEIVDGDSVNIKTDGADPVSIEPSERNTLIIAVRLFFETFNLKYGANIFLKKNIPIGAGLGGGSGDAGCLLNWLFDSFSSYLNNKLKISIAEQSTFKNNLALKIGADVPYFLSPTLAVVEGIGEKITKLEFNPLTGVQCCIIYPKVVSQTAAVYKNFAGNCLKGDDRSAYLKTANKNISYQDIINSIDNDLFLPAVNLNPKIGTIMEILKRIDGIITGMTGSGSAFFALPCDPLMTEGAMRKKIDIFTREQADIFYCVL